MSSIFTYGQFKIVENYCSLTSGNFLKSAYLLAKIGADTAENERKFAKNWQLPYGSAERRSEPLLARNGGAAAGVAACARPCGYLGLRG